ncbi:MAG: acyltransferase [Planctomycetes bacterium]|nr:acyltransferase [Planctomycetota bacterium]
MPAPDWLDRGQIPGLDGLRAIAVMLVLLVHAEQTPGFPDWLRVISHHGAIGVDTFFVISGFLITTLLARELERTGKINLKRFYARRFLRIIPAYCALLVAVACCQLCGKFHLQARDWVAALTYTTNFLYHPSWELGHTWSLSVEEHFYLLWPFALFAAGIIGGWRTALGCIFGCWGLRCFVALVLPALTSREIGAYYSALSENSTFTRLDTISAGCLLALACRNDVWRGRLDRLTRPGHLVAYFATLCVSLALSVSAKYHLCASYTINAFCISMLMWGMIRSEGWAARILANPILTTLGIGSYSIYLWQQLFIHPRQTDWIHAFPQNIALSLGVACLSFWWIERPFNRLKDRMAK